MGLDPITAKAIGSIGSGALGGLFAPQGQEFSSFEGQTAPGGIRLDPRVTLGRALSATKGLGDTLAARIGEPTGLLESGAFVQQPGVFSNSELPFDIGLTAFDINNPFLNATPPLFPPGGLGGGGENPLAGLFGLTGGGGGGNTSGQGPGGGRINEPGEGSEPGNFGSGGGVDPIGGIGSPPFHISPPRIGKPPTGGTLPSGGTVNPLPPLGGPGEQIINAPPAAPIPPAGGGGGGGGGGRPRPGPSPRTPRTPFPTEPPTRPPRGVVEGGVTFPGLEQDTGMPMSEELARALLLLQSTIR